MINIIAEIGINHDGNKKKAKQLILESFEAGANSVKFQYRNINRAYYKHSNEIGDAIIKSEIERNFISPSVITDLSIFAKNIGLNAGISFFTIEDFYDFQNHAFFDFYKLPSVEFLNHELLKKMLDTLKTTYVSTGCQKEASIESHVKLYSKYKNVNYMHCVSNYPLATYNSNFNYIKYFKKKYKKNIGYSSHDSDWRINLLAVSFGANIIERHITLGDRKGLDESSSSNVDEFREMVNLIKVFEEAKGNYGPRKINQGEMLNQQNLGRSFYVKSDFKKGTILKKGDLIYSSPATGLKINEIDNFIDKPINKEIRKGEVLSRSYFLQHKKITNKDIDFCKYNKISLPVRLHDFIEIKNNFPISSFEFHLSYKEIDEGLDRFDLSSDDKYSLHLPDYIDPLNLFDPFGDDEVGLRSRKLTNSVINFVKKIQDLTGKNCEIITSLSVVKDDDIPNFYNKIAELQNNYLKQQIDILPQWLPPIAWYFGGSFPIKVFYSSEDINFLEKLNIKICFDTAHFIMGLNSFKVNVKDHRRLLNISKHIHISGAEGLDGEGTSFVKLKQDNFKLIENSINVNCTKVIETWQGHLDNFFGFKNSIFQLRKMF